MTSHAVAGFERAGLYPTDRNAIPASKLKLATTLAKSAELSEAEDSSDSDNSETDTETEASDKLIIDDNETNNFVTPKSPRRSKRLRVTDEETTTTTTTEIKISNSTTTNSNSSNNHQIINSRLNNVLNLNAPKQTKNKEKKSKKVVSKSGGCITSDEAVRILREERAAKEAKEAESYAKKETKQQAKLKQKEFNAIKKANKARKICHLCEINMKSDKENCSRWLSCFRCGARCCYTCLPSNLKRLSASAYRCEINNAFFFKIITFFFIF